MKCDSRTSLLAHTFASPCFGLEPKAKVATSLVQSISTYFPTKQKFHNCEIGLEALKKILDPML
jgi:hypothetical protein